MLAGRQKSRRGSVEANWTVPPFLLTLRRWILPPRRMCTKASAPNLRFSFSTGKNGVALKATSAQPSHGTKI